MLFGNEENWGLEISFTLESKAEECLWVRKESKEAMDSDMSNAFLSLESGERGGEKKIIEASKQRLEGTEWETYFSP